MNAPVSLAERLALAPPDVRAAALARLTPDQQEALRWDWRGYRARPSQIAPEGDWGTWLILAGRGFGKTRTGAEWVREKVLAGARRIALVAETQKDLEEVMIAGDSGLLGVFPPEQAPEVRYKPVRVRFHTGAVALGYNGTQPNQLRGPQFDAAWLDELAKYRYAEEAWDMLSFALRLGDNPQACVTTTPRPIQLIRDMLKRDGEGVVVTRGRTSDNRAHLAPKFLKAVLGKYEGTRLGRQELNAEVLDDAPGALWTRAVLEEHRRKQAPELTRIVVAVDPAANDGELSDTDEPGENGIVAAGIGADRRAYVIEDASLVGSPKQWASRAVATFDRFGADCVVVEINQGGAMVASTLRSVRPTLPIREVRATRGKHIRAEPISALYEQGRVSHVGTFADLEDQMTLMTAQGYLGARSPDRLDALVWALTELFPQVIAPVERPRPRPPARPMPGSWMGV